jgi:hypothetical protein
MTVKRHRMPQPRTAPRAWMQDIKQSNAIVRTSQSNLKRLQKVFRLALFASLFFFPTFSGPFSSSIVLGETISAGPFLTLYYLPFYLLNVHLLYESPRRK